MCVWYNVQCTSICISKRVEICISLSLSFAFIGIFCHSLAGELLVCARVRVCKQRAIINKQQHHEWQNNYAHTNEKLKIQCTGKSGAKQA